MTFWGILQSDGELFDPEAHFFRQKNHLHVERPAFDREARKYFLGRFAGENLETALGVPNFVIVNDDHAQKPKNLFHGTPVPKHRLDDFDFSHETRGDHHVMALLDGGQKFSQFLDGNRLVGIHEHGDLAPAAQNTNLYGRAFAGVLFIDEPQGNWGIFLFYFPEQGEGVVRAAVVYGDYFVIPVSPLKVAENFPNVFLNIFGFIETRQDHRY